MRGRAIIPLIGVSSKPEYASNMYINGNVIIHEISHSFTNPILENYENEEQEVGRIICPYMEQELYRAGYDWQSLYGEFFNSLMTNLYLKDVYPSLLGRSISADQSHGFVWMKEAVDFMDRSSENRDKYRTHRTTSCRSSWSTCAPWPHGWTPLPGGLQSRR